MNTADIVRSSFITLSGIFLLSACGSSENNVGSVTGATELDPRPDKVAICHVPPGNPANAHTIVVGRPAVSAHIAHGDHVGPCLEDEDRLCDSTLDETDEDGKKRLVCHVPPGNPENAHTISISKNAVAAHLAHGDYLGRCSAACPAPDLDGDQDVDPDDGDTSGDQDDGQFEGDNEPPSSCPTGVDACDAANSCGEYYVCHDGCCAVRLL